LSLSLLRERVKEIQPNFQKEEIMNRLDNTYKQVKKSKKLLLSNPKKLKKLDSLLVQIEKLLTTES
jgi:ParB family chromosome partitioning protein